MLRLHAIAVLLLSSLFHTVSVAARPGSYAVWAADSAIARHQGNGLDANGNAIVSYEHGEFQWGLRQLYERTGNTTYFNYIKQGIDNVVFDNGTVHGSYVLCPRSSKARGLTWIVLSYVLIITHRTGPTMIYLYEGAHNKSSKYKIAVDTFRGQLNSHPRTTQGQFWHKLKYPNQGWLDGIYMGEIFYADYTSTFEPQNNTAWNDITDQFVLMFQNTLQNTTAPNNTGLMYHGYDHSHVASWASADRGHSPEVWDRALGWYSMALVDVLDIIPESHPGYSKILSILQLLVPRIRDAADPTSGAWWLVITQPGRAKNYFESSGTAMFVYAMLKAVRLGHVHDENGSIVLAAKKAYSYMVSNWVVENQDGTMNWLNTVVVGSLDTTGDFNYYVSQATDVNDLKGLAAFLLASIEYEKLPEVQRVILNTQ